MKNILLYAAIAISAIAALGGGYYYYRQVSDTSITVMYDITDRKQVIIDTASISEHIGSCISDWGQTHIRILPISDFRSAKAVEVNIDAQFPLTANPYTRKQKVQNASHHALGEMMKVGRIDSGRTHSIIFVPIVTELNQLAASKSGMHGRKELIVYSDLQENDSSFFSVYRSREQGLLRDNPDTVREIFNAKAAISDLRGITLYLIYDAPDPESQDRFLTIGRIWQEVFKAHRIDSVIISPNLPLK